VGVVRPSCPRRYALAAALSALLLAGCSEPAPPSGTGEDERAAAGEEAPATRAENPAADESSHGSRDPSTSKKSDSPVGGTKASGDKGDSRASTGATDAAPEISGAISRVVDPEGDLEGDSTPVYVDIVEASIESQGRRVRLQFELAEDLPKRLSENERVLAGIGILEDEDHPPYAFIIDGAVDGWQAFYQADRVQSPFEGPLDIDGSTVSFETSWAAIGGARSFDWGVTTKWYGGPPEAVEEGGDRAPETPQTYRM
jgi:hypothetical protein